MNSHIQFPLLSFSLEKLYKIAEYLDIVPPLGSDIDNNNYSRINDPKYLLEEIVFPLLPFAIRLKFIIF